MSAREAAEAWIRRAPPLPDPATQQGRAPETLTSTRRRPAGGPAAGMPAGTRAQRRRADAFAAVQGLLALVFERLPPAEQAVTVSRLSSEWRAWAAARHVAARRAAGGATDCGGLLVGRRGPRPPPAACRDVAAHPGRTAPAAARGLRPRGPQQPRGPAFRRPAARDFAGAPRMRAARRAAPPPRAAWAGGRGRGRGSGDFTDPPGGRAVRGAASCAAAEEGRATKRSKTKPRPRPGPPAISFC
jgi:hypothetical protein